MAVEAKHLPGEHDQSDHGRKGPGLPGAPDAPSWTAIDQGPSPLDYSSSTWIQPTRMAIVDPGAGGPPKGDFGFAELHSLTYNGPSGRRLKNPRKVVTPGAAPGTVAFVDYSLDQGFLNIHYMKTRGDRGRQGLATELVAQLIEAHPGMYVNFGKLMNETSARVYEKMRERFPDRQFTAKIWYKQLVEEFEGKGVRKVRTREGAEHYGQPVGSIIRPDANLPDPVPTRARPSPRSFVPKLTRAKRGFVIRGNNWDGGEQKITTDVTRAQLQKQVDALAKAMAADYDAEPPKIRLFDNPDEYTEAFLYARRQEDIRKGELHHRPYEPTTYPDATAIGKEVFIASWVVRNLATLEGADEIAYPQEWRKLAHEVAHTFSEKVKWNTGVQAIVEEAGAEVLSLDYAIRHFGPGLTDTRWTETYTGQQDEEGRMVKVRGVEALIRGHVYSERVAEVIAQAIRRKGWDRDAVLTDIEQVFRGDENDRLDYFDIARDKQTVRFRSGGKHDPDDPGWGPLFESAPDGLRQITFQASDDPDFDRARQRAGTLLWWLLAGDEQGPEEKGVRKVRTPEGAEYYGQPIGSIIGAEIDLPDIDTPTFEPKPEWNSDGDYQVSRDRENAWTRKIRTGLALGHLTQDQAKELGYHPTGHDNRENVYREGRPAGGWQPLPSVLYHTTTAGSAVRDAGLLSRDELAQEQGLGLGGGESDTISFTTDEGLARSIRDSILEMRGVVRGERTIDQLLEEARNGTGAREPFFTNLMKQFHRAWEDGDPLPFGVQALVDGRRYSSQEGSLSQFLALTEEEVTEKLGPEWRPLEESGRDVPKGRVYMTAWRPLTDEEQREKVADFFKNFLAWREFHGGPPNPVFFSSNTAGLADIDPDEVQVLRFRPAPGGQGYPVSGMSEWRTTSGRALWLDEDEREEKALVRRVRTPEGARRYGQPIGSVIKPDLLPDLPDDPNLDPDDYAQMMAALTTEPPGDKPVAIIFDRDGTLASVPKAPTATVTAEGHTRRASVASWAEYNAAMPFDRPVPRVAALLRAVPEGVVRIMVSGRAEGDHPGDRRRRFAMQDWIAKHKLPIDELFMRSGGDMRRDSIVKEELLTEEILEQFDVRFAVDDRPQVIEVWEKYEIPHLAVIGPDLGFPIADRTPDSPDITPEQDRYLDALRHHPVNRLLGQKFAAAGHPLFLVGGSVRDALAGHPDFADLDYTTDATPEQIHGIVDSLGPVWGMGEVFGTVGIQIQGLKTEVTTFRTERYDEDSRKPVVDFGDNILDDLRRRDLTMNSMALTMASDGVHPVGSLVDPHGGAADLAAGLLRTPDDPAKSMSEDPLRQLRVVRFAAKRNATPSPELRDAIVDLNERLSIISPERKTAELRKILEGGPAITVRAMELAEELGVAGHLFGGLDISEDARRSISYLPDRTDPVTQLAVLAYHSRAANPGRKMGAMRLSNEEARPALDAAKLATLLTDPDASADPIDARRLVRNADPDTLARALTVAQVVAPRRQSTLSRTAWVYVAEHALENHGLAGDVIHVPEGHIYHPDPEKVAAIQPLLARAREIAASEGFTDFLNLYTSDYDLSRAGHPRGMVKGGTTTIVLPPVTNELTLLHEVAHIVTGTGEDDEGHGPGFTETAARLYERYLGPEAAQRFRRFITDYERGSPQWTPLRNAVATVLEDERDAVRAPLPIGGSDLLAAGLSGPAVGAALRKVTDAFLANPQLARDEALRIAGVESKVLEHRDDLLARFPHLTDVQLKRGDPDVG